MKNPIFHQFTLKTSFKLLKEYDHNSFLERFLIIMRNIFQMFENKN